VTSILAHYAQQGNAQFAQPELSPDRSISSSIDSSSKSYRQMVALECQLQVTVQLFSQISLLRE
jgi:hypothetical protein